MTQPFPGSNRPQSPMPPQPKASDPIATMIPYRNVCALVSYYLGVFSLIPCAGLLLGIAAVILGILGLRAAGRNPEAKGKAHAITGIVLGIVFGLGGTFGFFALFALMSKH